MATISFNLTENHEARLVDAICGQHRYDESKSDGESRAAFAKRQVAEWMILQVKRWDRAKALEESEANIVDIQVG